jgi:hypothetical protein
MSRNFGVERKPADITESEYRFVRNLCIALGVMALVLAAIGPVLLLVLA